MEQFFRNLRISNIITSLHVLSLWLLVAMIPFRMGAFPRLVMILAGVFFFLDYGVHKRWQSWSWHKDKWLYVVMIAYYLYTPLWHIFTTVHSTHFGFVMGERLPFAMCGIIGLLGLNKAIRLRDIAYVMLSSAVLTSLYIILRGKGLSFFALPWMEQSILFTWARIEYVNSHMMYNLFLNISFIFAFYLLQQEGVARKMKVAILLACVWIFYVLCLTEGRVGLAMTLLLVAFLLLFALYRYSKKLLALMLILLAGIGAIVIGQKQRMETEIILDDPRVYLWMSAAETAADAPIFGHGVCDARQRFSEHVLSHDELASYHNRIRVLYGGNPLKMQPHNAFLEAWSEFGLLGLGTLLFIFLFPLRMQPKQNRLYIVMIVGCFVMQSCFDSFFTPLLYCFSILFFTSQSEISAAAQSEKPVAE